MREDAKQQHGVNTESLHAYISMLVRLRLPSRKDTLHLDMIMPDFGVLQKRSSNHRTFLSRKRTVRKYPKAPHSLSVVGERAASGPLLQGLAEENTPKETVL